MISLFINYYSTIALSNEAQTKLRGIRIEIRIKIRIEILNGMEWNPDWNSDWKQ